MNSVIPWAANVGLVLLSLVFIVGGGNAISRFIGAVFFSIACINIYLHLTL